MSCRTCNDTGLIPAEYGSQPCPRCDGYERMVGHIVAGVRDRSATIDIDCGHRMTIVDDNECAAIQQCATGIRAGNVVEWAAGDPPREQHVFDVSWEEESRCRRDDDIPSEWVAVAAYLIALGIGLIVLIVIAGLFEVIA